MKEILSIFILFLVALLFYLFDFNFCIILFLLYFFLFSFLICFLFPEYQKSEIYQQYIQILEGACGALWTTFPFPVVENLDEMK